jgi:SAM-dependent methyltransferase
MPDELARLRRVWNELGADDPLWAILSRPDMRGGRWDEAVFFATGETEIAAIDAFCVESALPRERGLALDFGCGVGRLTRALAKRYGTAVGVDISQSMIAAARRLNAGIGNIRFVENAAANLDFLAAASVDFVYSAIVLQHMPAALQLAYIDAFLRVLAPGGVAVFQFASAHAHDWRGLVYRLLPNAVLAPLRRLVHGSRVAADMHVLDERRVTTLIAQHGRRVLQAVDTNAAGAGFCARMYFVG